MVPQIGNERKRMVLQTGSVVPQLGRAQSPDLQIGSVKYPAHQLGNALKTSPTPVVTRYACVILV